ncbi:unnamed protein product [Mesocestoides corti]|uniref:Cysteine-rich DPF motif domain-containing protein 1 n=1 Tax=Mesocestoides corti TaxID=53468 RepID=A0A0R3UG33_MESCO|nr:unnamed protein product [Mesocestoides corti]
MTCRLLEVAYTMRDPFVDGCCGGIVIGADCCVCNTSVCVSQECSFFYGKRYCKECAQRNVDHFPADMRRVGTFAKFKILTKGQQVIHFESTLPQNGIYWSNE